MAITALYSAASGLRALSTSIDVVANNLANAETTAFKRSRVNFEDLYYLQMKQPGTTDAAGDVAPAGIFVGLGTKISNTQLDLEQGSLESTTRDLDAGIQGNGFFAIKILDSLGGTGYTRNGNFFVNEKGELVLGMGDGYKVVPPITLPPNYTDLSIGLDGTIQYVKNGTTVKQTAGQLQITQFPNPQGLKLLGGSIYVTTEASGKPLTSTPGQNGAGQTLGGFLEASNVDPVKELVTLIKTQRSFELNSQSIQTADQALQVIGNLRKG
ncbi:MAG TPA: flagellar basal-body rod protein FlgG [Tepidisphaeraceae bacterium]|jgi:flagellar basal-body rod protein FlgG|nr:flagellar basal-body rod protein FlgG [Tepidisphaeraceae bacterium]